jgi:hypothetical protein
MKKIIFSFSILFSMGNFKLLAFDDALWESLIKGRSFSSEFKIEWNKEYIFDSPINTWLKILSWRESEAKSNHCLFYKVPKKGEKGSIAFLKDCAKLPQKKGAYFIERASFSFRKDGEKTPYFVVKSKQKIISETPLINSVWDKKRFSIQRYANSSGQKGVQGLWPITLDTIREGKSLKGEWEDDFSKKNAILCHSFNRACKEVLPYECDRCRYGWYEVVDYACPQGGRKFCGQNRCGERNRPACLRGHGWDLKAKKEDICSSKSSAGFCQKGLSLICNSDNILTCL